VTNNLAVLTPYQITFVRSVRKSPKCSPACLVTARFIVKSIKFNWLAPLRDVAGNSGTDAVSATLAGSPAAARRGGAGQGRIADGVNEQLLRVTLVVEVVKLLPKK